MSSQISINKEDVANDVSKELRISFVSLFEPYNIKIDLDAKKSLLRVGFSNDGHKTLTDGTKLNVDKVRNDQVDTTAANWNGDVSEACNGVDENIKKFTYFEIENNGEIIDINTYNSIIAKLKKKLPINERDKCLKSGREQFIAYLIKRNILEDRDTFLKEFRKFINVLPEVPNEFLDCSSKLMKINFDDILSDEISDDDPRLIKLKTLLDEMSKSCKAYQFEFKMFSQEGYQAVNGNVNIHEQKEQNKENYGMLLKSSLTNEKYPELSKKLNRIFNILQTRVICEDLNNIIEKIGKKLGLDSKSTKKLKGYINATKQQKDEDVKNRLATEGDKNLNRCVIGQELENNTVEKLKNTNFRRVMKIDDASYKIGKHELCANNKNPKYNKTTLLYKTGEYYDQIKNWRAENLKEWSDTFKGKLCKNFWDSEETQEEIYKAIAIMDRANQIATDNHRLRDIQKVAILNLMQTNGKGHISQINTGEGKTTIISIVAALKVMLGYKTHIITSNNVLAAEGGKNREKFYKLLNITVADNNPDEQYTDGPKPCYSKDVVYGSITSFQFDWLRDSFEQLMTLGGINYHNIWVFLDEIDSLLIDHGSNIAKLSGPFPGMESLRYVYMNIWIALAEAEEKVPQEILGKLKSKAADLYAHPEIDENLKQIKYEEYEDSLRESFLEEVKKRIKGKKDNLINKKIIASHLHQYVEDSVDRWIEYAFTAKYQYKENVEYKIIKDKNQENIIIPIDNQNTGVSMKNTILSNGLHQFLQIKHNLCLTYESLTSCYVSNLDYIKKYGSKLSGVTGTLGSKPEQDLLGSAFNLGFSIIPPFKPKLLRQFSGQVSADKDFVNAVAIAALGELTRVREEYDYVEETPVIRKEIPMPRAVLIVCKSILDCELIAKEIEQEANGADIPAKIKKYMDEDDAHITKQTLHPFDIIIATNLAGRGADFKTTTILEHNGGLHVIVAFLPCNKRVEDQALGRTARQGNNGTGQIFVRKSEIETLDVKVDTFDEVFKRRDELETLRVNYIRDIKVTELEFKGQLFNKFSARYGSLKENNNCGNDGLKWIYVLRDLKEKWAFWLENQSYTGNSIKKIIANQHSKVYTKGWDEMLTEAVEQEYAKFEKEAQPIINGNVMHNPYYSICLAERYLENSTIKAEREKAKAEIEYALKITTSSELLYSAYIKLFEIAIENGEQILKRYKKALEDITGRTYVNGLCKIAFEKLLHITIEDSCPDYKEIAIYNLELAKKALSIEHDYLQELLNGKSALGNNENIPSILSIIMMSQLSIDENSYNNKNKVYENMFVKHLNSRFICLGTFKGNIESLIKQIKGEETVEKEEDRIGYSDGVILDCRVSRYLNNLDSNNPLKKHIAVSSVDELEFVGMSAVYQVRKIHDVHRPVIIGAQVQFLGAAALLGSAMAFPFLLPVHGPLAGAMISEGVTDIITALIQNGQSAFNKKDYIKGKAISYGITLFTMGISSLMNSTELLQKAINACRSLASKLRAVKGPFSVVCNFLANQLDNIAKYLEQMIQAIEYARKAAEEQVPYLAGLKDEKKLELFQKLKKTLKVPDVVISNGTICAEIVTQSVIGSVQGVVISVAMERIMTASLNNLMKGIQTVIIKTVTASVSTKIKAEHSNGTFKNISETDFDKVLARVLNKNLEEDVKHVCKEIGLGILRHSSNWKIQLATLATECVLIGVDVTTCINKICNQFIDNFKNISKKANKETILEFDLINNKMINVISNLIYGNLVAITGKVLVTLPQALYRGYKEHKEKKADAYDVSMSEDKLDKIDAADNLANAENTNCPHTSVSELIGFNSKQLADATNTGASKNGGSIKDIIRLCSEIGIDAKTCEPGDALYEFNKHCSDRGVACLSKDGRIGHTVVVKVEGSCLMVTDKGNKLPLDQYITANGFTKTEIVVPKNVNSSTLPDIRYQFNLNRIKRATHSIDYVGKGDGLKFGACISPEKEEKLKTLNAVVDMLEKKINGGPLNLPVIPGAPDIKNETFARKKKGLNIDSDLVIYKGECKKCGACYIGHTKNTLEKRLMGHKSHGGMAEHKRLEEELTKRFKIKAIDGIVSTGDGKQDKLALRLLEQVYINKYESLKSDGKGGLNKKNAIAKVPGHFNDKLNSSSFNNDSRREYKEADIKKTTKYSPVEKENKKKIKPSANLGDHEILNSILQNDKNYDDVSDVKKP